MLNYRFVYAQLENLTKTESKTLAPPTREELSLLSLMEKNRLQADWKNEYRLLETLMTFCQRHISSFWIIISTTQFDEGFRIGKFWENRWFTSDFVGENHHSMFDMYVVSTTLFRQTNRKFNLYFPVRAKVFYDSLIGLVCKFVMSLVSMFPPFFTKQVK